MEQRFFVGKVRNLVVFESESKKMLNHSAKIVVKKLEHALEVVLGPELCARLEYKSGFQRYFYPWGGPFNGQRVRTELVEKIIRDCSIVRVIETGTFRGASTEWFSRLGLPVISVESNRKFYAFSNLRLKGSGNVDLILGGSIQTLSNISTNKIITMKRTFSYSDAHWEKNFLLEKKCTPYEKISNSIAL